VLDTLSNFNQRLIMSSISLCILLIAVNGAYTPNISWLLPTLVAFGAGGAVWEYYSLAQKVGAKPAVKSGVVSSILYIILVYLTAQNMHDGLLSAGYFGLIFLGLFISYFYRGEHALVNLATTLFGILYITLPLSCAVRIFYDMPQSEIFDGRWWLWYVLIVTKMNDTMAYFTGKKFGKKKLAPVLSPKKTIEGAVGGFIGSVGASVIFWLSAHYLGETARFTLTLFQAFWLGSLLSIAAQVGDLAESLLKRDAHVKDSSFIPGLGGVLDIVDSLLFTLPVVYFFLAL
jgi:phosphatidate cytidylyltransferase